MGYIGKKKKNVWVFTRFGNESGVESGKFALVSKRYAPFFTHELYWVWELMRLFNHYR